MNIHKHRKQDVQHIYECVFRRLLASADEHTLCNAIQTRQSTIQQWRNKTKLTTERTNVTNMPTTCRHFRALHLMDIHS